MRLGFENRRKLLEIIAKGESRNRELLNKIEQLKREQSNLEWMLTNREHEIARLEQEIKDIKAGVMHDEKNG